MQHAEIHDLVEHGFGDLTLDRPVAAVVARGDRLCQRRQRLPVLGVLTLGAMAALTLQVSPHHGQVFAAWTSRAQATDARTAAAIDGSCRTGGIPAAFRLRVLDRRGDFALSIYTDGRSIAVCDRFRGEGTQFFTQGGTSGPTQVARASTVTAQHPVVIERGQATMVAYEGTTGSAFGWVDPSVAKVVIDSGDYATTATLSDGLFSGWWPGEGERRPRQRDLHRLQRRGPSDRARDPFRALAAHGQHPLLLRAPALSGRSGHREGPRAAPPATALKRVRHHRERVRQTRVKAADGTSRFREPERCVSSLTSFASGGACSC